MPDYDKPGSLAVIDVVVLCGGSGSRLRPIISDRPKGLAPLGGRPFLDILAEDLIRQGFQRIIFCVGHLKDQIISRYKSRSDAECLFSQEDFPLGTGGAVKNALPLIRSDTFLVINGDSLCRVEFGKFCEFHRDKSAAVSMVLTDPEERDDGGAVCLNGAGQIRSFTEKSNAHRQGCFINAGIYLMQKEGIGLQQMEVPFSLECGVFPALIKVRPCFGFVVGSRLIDIGTPERYWKANEEYRQ